jgi:hypothetical protein
MVPARNKDRKSARQQATANQSEAPRDFDVATLCSRLLTSHLLRGRELYVCTLPTRPRRIPPTTSFQFLGLQGFFTPSLTQRKLCRVPQFHEDQEHMLLQLSEGPSSPGAEKIDRSGNLVVARTSAGDWL